MFHRLLIPLIWFFLAAPAFWRPPESARVELEELGVDYSAESFFSSVRADDYRVVKLFLLSGMNPDIRDAGDMTALMYSARNGYELIAEILLEAGADVNAAQDGPFGKTALIFAAEKKKPEMVRLLLVDGADSDAQDAQGRTALMVAAANGSEAIVKDLLLAEAGVDIEAADGRTALIYASEAGNNAIVEALLAAGADANHRAEEGTAADYARRARLFEIVHILEQAGAE